MKKWLLCTLIMGLAGMSCAAFPAPESSTNADTIPRVEGAVIHPLPYPNRLSVWDDIGGAIIMVPPQGSPYMNVFEMIQGRVAGVWVSGSLFNYRIRVRAATGPPLLVIDGMPFYGFDDDQINDLLLAIPPADVQYIEILKGIAQTSIYGPGSGNGVVVVQTRKGASD